MKLLLALLALLPFQAFAQDCATFHNEEYCVGDKITNVSWIDFPRHLHAEIFSLDPIEFKLPTGSIVKPKEYLGGAWIKTSDVPRCTQAPGFDKVCLGDVVNIWKFEDSVTPGSLAKLRIEGMTRKIEGSLPDGEYLTGFDLSTNKAVRISRFEIVVTKGAVPDMGGLQIGQAFPNAHGSKDRIVGVMPRFHGNMIIELGESGKNLRVDKKAVEVRFKRLRSFDHSTSLDVREMYRTGTKKIDQEFRALVDRKAQEKLQKFCNEMFIDRKAQVSNLILADDEVSKRKIYESFEPQGPFGKYVFSLDPKYSYVVISPATATCSY
jgi:hypothetical protein